MRLILVLNHYHVGKHFTVDITDNSFDYERHTDTIEREAALDGLYVIRTSVSPKILGASETVNAYKGLSNVEQAFRCLKSVDLKVRPIYHRTTERVKSQIF